MTKGKDLITYRVDELEKTVGSIDGKIDRLMTNHLPHLEQKVIVLSTRINVLTVVNVGAIILAAVIQRLLT